MALVKVAHPQQSTTCSSETNGTKSHSESDKAIPFQGKRPYGMPSDIVIPKVMNIDDTEERPWVRNLPGSSSVLAIQLTNLRSLKAPSVTFRPLLFNTSQGCVVDILHVKRSGILSRHQHTGPFSAHSQSEARWHYLEHDWWAEEGGYSFEPLGRTHILDVPDDYDEMATLFHVTGAYVYVDPYGKAEKVEDVFSKIKMAREHYEKVGLGADFANEFIR